MTRIEKPFAQVRLYGADFVKGVPQGSYPFSCPSVSLFDLAARFFVPTHSIETPARAGAVKDGRVAPTRKGLVLDGSEHDGTLVVVGMTTSEGSPRVVARTFVSHPCMRWVWTQTMMQ